MSDEMTLVLLVASIGALCATPIFLLGLVLSILDRRPRHREDPSND